MRHAKEALDKGADVILFHEELLIGCTKNVRELAELLDGPTTRAFQTLLKDSKALVICGLQEREGDRYYIAATVIRTDGVVANYRKTHLFWKADGATTNRASTHPAIAWSRSTYKDTRAV